MSTITGPRDGGQAFPEPFIYDPDLGACGRFITASQATGVGGMSLRDYFAAKALQGMIANPDFGQPKDQSRRLGKFADRCASLCYEIADAMLAARITPRL